MTPDARRVLARNTAWNYGGFAINLIANLVTLPFVVSHIGETAAGVWLLMSAVTGYMGLLELGIVPSLTQSIAAARARNEFDAVSRAASSALALLVGLASLTLIVLPAAGTLAGLFQVPAELEGPAATALQITVLGFALRMPLAAFQGVLLGSQRQDLCNQLWIGLAAAKLAAAVAVLSAGYGLVGLVCSEMAMHLLAGVFQVRWAFTEVPDLRLSWRLVRRAEAQTLLSFGGAIFLVMICSLIIEQTDRLVIAAFLPIGMVTHYAVAWKVYALASSFTTTLVQAVAPVAADLHGRRDSEALRSLFLRTTKYTAALAWPLVMTLGLTGGFLLQLWMGPEFVTALPVVQVLFVGFLVTAHNHAGYSTLIGMRRVGPLVPLYFVPQAVLNLVLSLWLVRSLGNIGVALGTMIPALALQAVFLRMLFAELQVSWGAFLRRAVLPAAVPAVLCYLPLGLLYLRVDPTSPVLLPAAGLCSAAYAAAFVRHLDPDERATLMSHLARLLRSRREAVPEPGPIAREPRT